MLNPMTHPFDEIDAAYQDIGRDLFGRDDLRDAVSRRDPDEAAFFTLVLAGSEIDNGGFAQFFTSSTGDLFAQALQGAERLDLSEHARLLRDAGSGLFPHGVPSDQAMRLEAWEALPDDSSTDDRLEQLDQRWYSLGDALEQRLLVYARSRNP